MRFPRLPNIRAAWVRGRLKRAARRIPPNVVAGFHAAARATSADLEHGAAVNDHIVQSWPALAVWGDSLKDPERHAPVTDEVLADAERLIRSPLPPDSHRVARDGHRWALWGAHLAMNLRGRFEPTAERNSLP